MGAFYQKIWFEKLIPDYLRARIVDTPGPYIIRSATSNYQRSPRVLVLLDGKYQISDVVSVTVARSRTIASNTATITLLNIGTRYSAANREKISVNIPVSIFFGFEGEYLQHYEGFIDTTSMTTDGTGSVITLTCRDRAKMFLEQKIDAGIYSKESDYFGCNDWHYRTETNRDGDMIRFPRAWTAGEVITDICYTMGLKDLGEYVYVVESELSSGEYAYARHIKYKSEFEVNIDPKFDTELVTNFVEQGPLDCLGKVCQSIMHEAVFDTDGRLIVRPIKKGSDPAVFYMKEERDISSITEEVDDDRLVNIVSVIGQTANESAVVYPFAPVAVKEQIQLDKGQDIYGLTIDYPKVVSPVSYDSLQKMNVFAPVIHPTGQIFHDPASNPENHPQYDCKFYYPNFANGYEKQEVLSSTCPIVTDTADWAPVGNKRKVYFFGALEEAIQFEFQPIMLKDRFGKPMRVVCRERSMNEGAIKWCGNEPFKPDSSGKVDDPESVQPVPEVLYGFDASTDSSGKLTLIELDKVETDKFTPVYGGLQDGDDYTLAGWMEQAGTVPLTTPFPAGISRTDINKVFGVNMFTAHRVSPTEPYKDTFANHKYLRNMVFYRFTRVIHVDTYVDNPLAPTATAQVFGGNIDDFRDISKATPIDRFVFDPNVYATNCSVAASADDPTGAWHISVPYLNRAPEGWAITERSEDVEITYPVCIYTTSPTSFGTAGEWHYVVWDNLLELTMDTIARTAGQQLKVASGRVPVWMMQNGDPDTNCIYWTWLGGYRRTDMGRIDTDFDGYDDTAKKVNNPYTDYSDDPRIVAAKAKVTKFDELRKQAKAMEPYKTAYDNFKKAEADYLQARPNKATDPNWPVIKAAYEAAGVALDDASFTIINVNDEYPETTVTYLDMLYQQAMDELTALQESIGTSGVPSQDEGMASFEDPVVSDDYNGHTYVPAEITFNDGEDWNLTNSVNGYGTGESRRLIKRDSFYKYASDPNTAVIEIITDGIDFKSWGEIVQLTENSITVFGHNQYGNMEDEFRKLAEKLERMLELIGLCLIIMAIGQMLEAYTPRPVFVTTRDSDFPHGDTGVGQGVGQAIMSSPGAAGSTKAHVTATTLLTLLLGLILVFTGIGAGIGRNISKVMENLTTKVTAIRREEIHLYQNSSQAATWWITGAMDHENGWRHSKQAIPAPSPEVEDSADFANFGWHKFHEHGRYSGYRNGMFIVDDEKVDALGRCWVFVLDLTKRGDASIPFNNGCYVTNVGWETPEVGDRNLIEYYETNYYREERTYRFKIECFGDDEINGYTAEFLLDRRFTDQWETDDWRSSYGYEVMVDQSMDDIAATDKGFWWQFYERREDYQPRIYKYLTLTVYSAVQTRYSNKDVDAETHRVDWVKEYPNAMSTYVDDKGFYTVAEAQVFAVPMSGLDWDDFLPDQGGGGSSGPGDSTNPWNNLDDLGSYSDIFKTLLGTDAPVRITNYQAKSTVSTIGTGHSDYLSSLPEIGFNSPILYLKTATGVSGDSDLVALEGSEQTANDVARLEFDMQVDPTVTRLTFEYVFASMEYPNYVGSSYNDVFGFFINGKNIAWVPGTTDTRVSINSIHGPANGLPGENEAYYVDNTGQSAAPIPYGGFTKVLTAEVPVTPGSTTHVKIAIADIADSALDSALYIRMRALPPVDPEPEPEPEPVYPDIRPIFSVDGGARWGLFVARGYNPSWYSKYRWLEDKTEQNYARFKVLTAGQQRLVTHIYNNSRYTSMLIDIRIWGKAYGMFAPTLVYYHDMDTVSMHDYGTREMTLTNECINDYAKARFIAKKLAHGTNVSYKMVTTGKPYLKEGDVIMVKEETTGAVAGTFRIWENNFKSPEERECTRPANQLRRDMIPGMYSPRCAIPSQSNNVMIACGSGSLDKAYILEVDKACNPSWWAMASAPGTPAFVFRIDGPANLANIIAGKPPTQAVKTVIGLKENQTVIVLDYAVAKVLNRVYVNAPILCGCTDEEQRYLWVGTEQGVSCIDLLLGQHAYVYACGPVYGIAAVNHQVYSKLDRENMTYQNCGVIFLATKTGIHAFQNWDSTYSNIGNRLGTLTSTSYSTVGDMEIPFNNPQSLTYTKSLNELVYVNGHVDGNNTASIMGIEVTIDYDVEEPDNGITVEFEKPLIWLVDYYLDAEIQRYAPDPGTRIEYIGQFFQPVFATRDINNELLVTDNVHNMVYKINPSGKFYITELQTTFDIQNASTSYMHNISAVLVENAFAHMLTNFGQNYITEKTDEQIEDQNAIGMGRITQIQDKGKFRVRLLGSRAYVTAYNNSSILNLHVGDTVLVSYFYGQRNMCAILGKKALHDWTVETGDPYIYVDATTIDATKYGQAYTEGSGGGSMSTDLSLVNSRLTSLEASVRMLKGLLGMNG